VLAVGASPAHQRPQKITPRDGRWLSRSESRHPVHRAARAADTRYPVRIAANLGAALGVRLNVGGTPPNRQTRPVLQAHVPSSGLQSRILVDRPVFWIYVPGSGESSHIPAVRPEIRKTVPYSGYASRNKVKSPVFWPCVPDSGAIPIPAVCEPYRWRAAIEDEPEPAHSRVWVVGASQRSIAAFHPRNGLNRRSFATAGMPDGYHFEPVLPDSVVHPVANSIEMEAPCAG